MTDVTSNAIRCYPLAAGTSAKTASVNAGDTVAFTAASSVSHPGPMQYYMAKVPSGQTAETWDGSGNVWFKIYQEEAIASSSSISWASSGKTHRHRLNRGGDRQANAALQRVVVSRLRWDKRTQAYLARRTGTGTGAGAGAGAGAGGAKSKAEAIRCLKRYVAREIYPVLTATPRSAAQPA